MGAGEDFKFATVADLLDFISPAAPENGSFAINKVT